MNDQCHPEVVVSLKIKSTVFGSSSSLSLTGVCDGLVCESVGKADLLSDYFDSVPSNDSVDLLSSYHPSASLTTFVFRSSEVKQLMFNTYGGTDHLEMFPIFQEAAGLFLVSVRYFSGFFVRVFVQLAVDRPMSSQYQCVHFTLRSPIIDQYQ